MTRHVIIGNGIAGLNAAEAIRALDADSPITMIARETFLPYSRPMISLVLQGAVGAEKLPIRDDGFYSEFRIDPIIGEEVTGIDVEERHVVTNKGTTVPFDRLLIASGADPRPVKADGVDLGNIFFMRTESHVKEMLEALPGVKHALVLGGGLVGFKAAYGLMNRGVTVTMLIRSGHPLSLQLDPTAGKLVLDELLAKGLDVRVEIEAISFQGNGSVQQAHLSDGSSLECELVVIGKGVLPAHAFVSGSGIQVDLGIVVDETLQTSVPGIYAAGDVAQAFDVTRRESWINAIWPVAVEQGHIAGMNMADRRVVYSGSMGRNVIRVFDLDVLAGGVVNPPEGDTYEVLERNSPRLKMHRRLVLRENIPVGLAMVGGDRAGRGSPVRDTESKASGRRS